MVGLLLGVGLLEFERRVNAPHWRILGWESEPEGTFWIRDDGHKAECMGTLDPETTRTYLLVTDEITPRRYRKVLRHTLHRIGLSGVLGERVGRLLEQRSAP